MSDSVRGGDPLERLEEAARKEARGVATKGQVAGVERRSSRRSQIAVALSILIAIASVAWSGWNTIQISQTEARYAAQEAITKDGLESLKAANEKLVAQGLNEIPLPREGEPVDADAIAAAAAALMYDRILNDPRFQGRPGDPGAPCLPSVPGCTGPEGKAGQGGSQGPQGPKGEDAPPVSDERIAAAVEAYCSREPSPCVGPQGFPGPEGPQGPPGQMGPEGPFCPPGFEARKKFVATDDAPLGEIVLVCDEV